MDNEGVTPLHWACAGGHTDCVQCLLANGANPNAMDQTEQQLTPLDYAIVKDHQELAQYLIAHGALTIASIQELAATMIQKVVRGYLTRKRTAHLRPVKSSPVALEESKPASESPASLVKEDVDLTATAHHRR